MSSSIGYMEQGWIKVTYLREILDPFLSGEDIATIEISKCTNELRILFRNTRNIPMKCKVDQVCNFLFGELMNSNRSQEKTVFRL